MINPDFRDSITVTIMVTDVDETRRLRPETTEVDHDENDSSESTVTYVPAVATYTATDPEDDQVLTRIGNGLCPGSTAANSRSATPAR